MPDEATTSLRTHLPGPCLCNDQPLTVYVAASLLLSLSLCLSLPCSQPLNRRCLALAVWLCLFRSACLALPVWLCLSRSAHLALPVWLCSALTQHTHPVCCRTTRDERQLAHRGMHQLSLSAHSHTLSAHILSVVSHAAHILPAVYEYTGVSALCVHHNFLFPRINPLFSFFSLIVQR